MTTADGDLIEEELNLDKLTYDSAKTRCTNNNEPGKVVFSFKIDAKSKIKTVTLSMRIASSLSEGYWEISHANLTITRADIDRKRTFPLRVSEMYASLTHSYSCAKLDLQTQHRKKSDNETGRIEPHAKITLDRFQLQPFPELESVVFGPSFDCSTWFSVPSFMGLVLILFMTTIIIIGVHFLQKMETNDFKYSKEGQLFTQSQVAANKNN